MKTNNDQKQSRHLIFPTFILITELILLLCNIFKISFYWLVTIQNLFIDASFCLNASLILVVIYLIYKRNELTAVSAGFLVCTIDFVLINNLYSNQKLNGIVSGIKNLWANYRIGTILLFIIITALCVLLVKFLLNGKERKVQSKNNNNFTVPSAEATGIPSAIQGQNQKRPKPNLQSRDVNMKADIYYKWCFIGMFFLFCVLIFIFLLVFVKGALIQGMSVFQGVDILERLGIISLLIIFTVALIILMIAMVATVCKYICDILFRASNKNFRDLCTNFTSEKIIKMAITLVLTPIIYMLGAKNTFTEYDLLDWLSTGSMLPLLIALLISFVVAAIVVNIVINLFDSMKFGRVKMIATDTIDQVIRICESLIKQLFCVIKACGPNFMEALCSLLFDDEEDT